MDFNKMYEEKQKRYNQLMQELQKVESYKQQLVNEILRLEGELRLLSELRNKDIIKEEEVV